VSDSAIAAVRRTVTEALAASDDIESLLAIIRQDSRFAGDPTALKCGVHKCREALSELRAKLMLLHVQMQPERLPT